jgi:uncharacterized membrane protein
MTPLAAIRADDVNLPLFLHVLGAMLLMGTLLAVALMLFAAWRRGDEGGGTLRRYAFRTLLLGTLPSYILMRVGAEWVQSEEFGDVEEDPGWIAVGYITSDAGAVLLLISLIVGGIAARRARTRPPDGGRNGARVVAVLVSLMLVAYVVAVWAMTAKP